MRRSRNWLGNVRWAADGAGETAVTNTSALVGDMQRMPQNWTFSLLPRHAARDRPDHIVAIATIVSRSGTLRGSAMIGAAWGVGRTITIVAVARHASCSVL